MKNNLLFLIQRNPLLLPIDHYYFPMFILSLLLGMNFISVLALSIIFSLYIIYFILFQLYCKSLAYHFIIYLTLLTLILSLQLYLFRNHISIQLAIVLVYILFYFFYYVYPTQNNLIFTKWVYFIFYFGYLWLILLLIAAIGEILSTQQLNLLYITIDFYTLSPLTIFGHPIGILFILLLVFNFYFIISIILSKYHPKNKEEHNATYP